MSPDTHKPMMPRSTQGLAMAMMYCIGFLFGVLTTLLVRWVV